MQVNQQLEAESTRMRLISHPIDSWPKLAWVARLTPDTDTVVVYHGPRVEVGDEWAVEAVWAGNFAAGDFDRTDLVFGTGVRCRDDRVVFVSSGTVLDRLCYAQQADSWYISNSLPALLAVTGLSLRDDYSKYEQDLSTICLGLGSYNRVIPAGQGEIRLAYFNNLIYDGEGVTETPKPDTAPHFDTFSVYRRYLTETAKSLAANMNDPARRRQVTPLVTVSSGYDASVAGVIAREAGCREAVTIRKATSLWRGSDSGEEIARCLGLACKTYERTARRYPLEESIWSQVGRPGIMNWSLFDYAEPLCVLFTGCHGDKVWTRSGKRLSDPFEMPSLGELGISEFRLIKGFFHCAVPYWGMRHVEQIRSIGRSCEMDAWTLDNDYDRPIPRRIVEEAGVPREAFGRRKKNTSHEAGFLWPYSPESQGRFKAFLHTRGLEAPAPLTVRLYRWIAWFDAFFNHNVTWKLGFRDRYIRRRMASDCTALLFQWANYELTQSYQAPFEEKGPQ